MDKIRHRAVIRYLGLKGLTPKHVHQDMEATFGEYTSSYRMVQKWAGEFKRGRVPGRRYPDIFSIFKV